MPLRHVLIAGLGELAHLLAGQLFDLNDMTRRPKIGDRSTRRLHLVAHPNESGIVEHRGDRSPRPLLDRTDMTTTMTARGRNKPVEPVLNGARRLPQLGSDRTHGTTRQPGGTHRRPQLGRRLFDAASCRKQPPLSDWRDHSTSCHNKTVAVMNTVVWLKLLHTKVCCAHALTSAPQHQAMTNDDINPPTQSAHVYLMSHGADGDHDIYWFGTAPTPEAVSDVLNHYNLSTPKVVIEEFLANPTALRPDLKTVNGQTYYLARHPHHREPG